MGLIKPPLTGLKDPVLDARMSLHADVSFSALTIGVWHTGIFALPKNLQCGFLKIQKAFQSVLCSVEQTSPPWPTLSAWFDIVL